MLNSKSETQNYKVVIDGKEWKYCLVIDKSGEEYGIEMKNIQNDSTAFLLPNVSENRDLVVNLILQMADAEVEPCHALNVIEDHIADCYTKRWGKALQ